MVSDELGRGGNGAAFVVSAGTKELVAKFYVPPDARDLDNNAFKRFVREIELASRLAHPYVIRAEGTGILTLGSITIPYYLMPRAASTLRSKVPVTYSRDALSDALRTFLRVCVGVSYLHGLGITHRDLKPENVLIFRGGVPRVSDFGIAQVAPGFVEWSRLTVPKDQLLNRDYYAPEQRFGDATEVDHRADIYALGCILYELVSGIPAVRPNLPKLASLDAALAPLQALVDRMTAHNLKDRVSHIAFVIDELAAVLPAMGRELSRSYSSGSPAETLPKHLTSFNAAARNQALRIAQASLDEALPILHEHLGHRRVDVAIAACEVLGELRDPSSLPYLVAALYPRRTARRPTFPTADAAAKAIKQYDIELRCDAAKSITEPIRPEDIKTIVTGLPAAVSFDLVLELDRAGRLYREFGDPGVALLAELDAARAWPLVKDRAFELYAWTIQRDLLPHLAVDQQREMLEHLVDRVGSYSFDEALRSVEKSRLEADVKARLIDVLVRRSDAAIHKYASREEFKKSASRILAALSQVGSPHLPSSG